jgi:hypothetical protein
MLLECSLRAEISERALQELFSLGDEVMGLMRRVFTQQFTVRQVACEGLSAFLVLLRKRVCWRMLARVGVIAAAWCAPLSQLCWVSASTLCSRHNAANWYHHGWIGRRVRKLDETLC